MRICLDLSPAVHHRGGIGRFVQELAAALVAVAPEHTYIAFYNRPTEAHPDPPADQLPRLTIPWKDKPWRLRVLLAHLARFPQDGLFPGVDLFHATDHLLPYMQRIPTVFTLYDLTYRLTNTNTTLNRLFLMLMLPRFVRTAGAVVTISEATRRDLLAYLQVDPKRVYVVYGGVAERFRPASPVALQAIRTRYRLPERFILTVGTVEPRKNYLRLLEAYCLLLGQGRSDGLVIAGKLGWRYKPFFQRLRELNLEQRVTLLGFVADDDLPALYSAAEVFVYPSLYEGFGLPPLEAMACGTPVVASNTSSLPEVVGNAGLLVSPYDVDALAAAIARLLDDPLLRAELRARGFQQAARFTWETAAHRTLEIYWEVLRRQK
jgi:glycosyltransferase involved in cell wall biosynthesis